MKKNIIFLSLFLSLSICSFAKKREHSESKNKEKSTKKMIICFGSWRELKSPITGEVYGKVNTNCWTAAEGWHASRIYYHN
jgi:hypothetical protein